MQQPPIASPADIVPARACRRALLIGIQYDSHDIVENRLDRPHSDVDLMLKYLTNIGWKLDDIRILRDNNRDIPPTRKNILEGIDWLVKDATPDDHLWFYYAGHGDLEPDLNGDESTPFDQAIVPVDAKYAGKRRKPTPENTIEDTTLHMNIKPCKPPTRRRTLETTDPTDRGYIIDDELRERMCVPLPAGCKLVALFDMCHSGTPLDLRYTYSIRQIPKQYFSFFQQIMPQTLQDVVSHIVRECRPPQITIAAVGRRHTRSFLRIRPAAKTDIGPISWGVIILHHIVRAFRVLSCVGPRTDEGKIAIPVEPGILEQGLYAEMTRSSQLVQEETTLVAAISLTRCANSPLFPVSLRSPTSMAESPTSSVFSQSFAQSPTSIFASNEELSVRWAVPEAIITQVNDMNTPSMNSTDAVTRLDASAHPNVATRPLSELPQILASVVSVGACGDEEPADDKDSLAKILRDLHESYGGKLTYAELLLGLAYKVRPQHPQLSASHEVTWSDYFLP